MLAGRYVLDPLPFRSGADGFIVRAENVQSGEEYAVKVFNLSIPEKRVRYQNEVKILTSLQCSTGDQTGNIPVIEFFEQQQTGYIVMSLAESDLYDLIEIEDTFTEEDALVIFSQICKAVAQLHAFGIAHLDIKPENILILAGNILLCDFSNSTFNKLEKVESFISTPAYTAPERFEAPGTNNQFDTQAADMWSLGILLHVLLTGCFPFRTDNSVEYPRKLDFSVVSSMVSPPCFKMMESLLSIDPSERPTISHLLSLPIFESTSSM